MTSPIQGLLKLAAGLGEKIPKGVLAFAAFIVLVMIIAAVYSDNDAVLIIAFIVGGLIALIAMIAYIAEKILAEQIGSGKQVGESGIAPKAAEVTAATQDLLTQLRIDIAEKTGMDPGDLRANVFRRQADGWSMVEEWTSNMEHHPEFIMVIPEGEGSTGRAAALKKTNVAVYEDNWKENAFGDPDLMDLLHDDLRWIISVPIVSQDSGTVDYVLNVDALRHERTPDQLSDAAANMNMWARLLKQVIPTVNQ